MQRTWLVIGLLALLVAGSFGCILELDTWQAGDYCDPYFDYDIAFCDDSTSVLYCASTGFVVSADCSAYCTGGYCGRDPLGVTYDACICEGWFEGDGCDPIWDGNESTCEDATMLLYCDPMGVIIAQDCGAYCTGGYCGPDPLGISWDACICGDRCWQDGCFCNYGTDQTSGTCDGDWLTSCTNTNVVSEVSCPEQCGLWCGEGVTGTCGQQSETGYNGCVCEYEGCDFDAYCADALTQVACEEGESLWTDCDQSCIQDGAERGACDAPTGLCICG